MRNTEPTANGNFAAILLAGGRSSRMGRDKAALEIDGTPLWRRQLNLLRALGPAELAISGHADGPYASAGERVIVDFAAGLGPLIGIASALASVSSPRALVLAIDLPAMTVEFLQTLLTENGGVIPMRGDFFEPLAAIYPKSAEASAREAAVGNDRSMQSFCRKLVDRGLARARPISAAEEPLFRNLNEPRDL